MMKNIIIICLCVFGLIGLCVFGLIGCGYSHIDNELIAQPKKILRLTPILCPNRVDVDVSLGVMRNGVGSMSQEDLIINIPGMNQNYINILNSAIEKGQLVKIKYNDARVRWCNPTAELVSVSIVEK